MKKNLLYQTKENNLIRIDLYSDKSSLLKPLIVLVHGFKGFKDWGFFSFTAEFLFNKGFNVLKFNFSHNGVGDSLTEFEHLDKFEKNTISLELSELNQIINACSRKKIIDFKPKKIGLLGHSRGGAVSILAASMNENVNSLCCWAAIAKFDRYTERQKSKWREKGYFEVLNSRTNQMMRMSVDLLDDIEKNKNNKFSIEKAVKNLKIPIYLIHGEQDLTVPIRESELLFEWADKKLAKFEKIEATGHTFDTVHPFSGSNKKFDKILNLTADFFTNSLNL